MKKIFMLFILFLFSSQLTAQEWTAKKIMEEQGERHKAKSEFAKEQMTLVDKKGNKEIRITRKYGKELEEDKSRFLIVFDSPKSVKGTALLTWNEKDQDADQWMYLPAQKRMQRIAKGSKKGYFMGTDFTFEDMQPEDQDNFDYTIIRSDKISGLDCWVIKAKPNNPTTERESGYKWRILYVLKKYFFTVKIEFFDKREKKIKTQVNGRLKRINGTRYRTNKSQMTNHETGHKTITEVVSREIDKPIDSTMFTERYITSGRHVK